MNQIRAEQICVELSLAYAKRFGLPIRDDIPGRVYVDLTLLPLADAQKAVDLVSDLNWRVASGELEGTIHPVPPRAVIPTLLAAAQADQPI